MDYSHNIGDLRGEHNTLPLITTFYSRIFGIILTLLLKGVISYLMNKDLYNIEAFGEILKSARISKGLTRKEAAQELEISPKTLVKYELLGVNDGGQSPSLPRLAKMISLYDIDPRYLFSSLFDNRNDQQKVLQGAHLGVDKTEPFMIEQLGCLSDAVTDEIDALDDNIESKKDYLSRVKFKEGSAHRQDVKRKARGEKKRRDLLLSEVENIENISIFSRDPEMEIHGPDSIFRKKQEKLKNEPEEERLASSSPGSTTPKSKPPKGRKDNDI